MTKWNDHGDPLSELNIQRRLKIMREMNEHGPRGKVVIMQCLVDRDPAMQRAVEEFDWLVAQ